MRLLAGLAVALLLALPAPAGAREHVSLPDIEDEVMCVECGTALNISTSAVAEDERDFIRQLIAEGRSKEEIKEALVAEFGPAVLATPQDEGFGLAAYVVPPLLALLAIVGVVFTVRRWRRAPAAATAAGPGLDDEEAQRLDRDMSSYDL